MSRLVKKHFLFPLVFAVSACVESGEGKLAEILSKPQDRFYSVEATKIRIGMSSDQVISILGNPEWKLEANGSPPQCHSYEYMNVDEKQYLQVRYTDGVVAHISDGWSGKCLLL